MSREAGIWKLKSPDWKRSSEPEFRASSERPNWREAVES